MPEMKELWLTPKALPSIPVEAEAICPDVVAGRTLKDVKGLEVYVGNETHSLGAASSSASPSSPWCRLRGGSGGS